MAEVALDEHAGGVVEVRVVRQRLRLRLLGQQVGYTEEHSVAEVVGVRDLTEKYGGMMNLIGWRLTMAFRTFDYRPSPTWSQAFSKSDSECFTLKKTITESRTLTRLSIQPLPSPPQQACTSGAMDCMVVLRAAHLRLSSKLGHQHLGGLHSKSVGPKRRTDRFGEGGIGGELSHHLEGAGRGRGRSSRQAAKSPPATHPLAQIARQIFLESV